MSDKTCPKVLEDGSICGQPISKKSQSKFCNAHKRTMHRKTRREKILSSSLKRVEGIMVEQVRAEFISEALSVLKSLGTRETLSIMFDTLRIVISRLNKGDIEYAGDD